jgi:hypothetical protein
MKLSQRVIGWGLVAFGAVSVFAGASPMFEAIHLEGVFIGLASFAAGAWVLAGKELRGTIVRALRAWQDARRASRLGQSGPGAIELMDRLLPVRILKLAREQRGVLTVAQVAMELNVPLDQARAGLDECVRAGNAFPDYDITRGHALYRFPEFDGPDRNLLSN